MGVAIRNGQFSFETIRFASELSSNPANFFDSGLEFYPNEDAWDENHSCFDYPYDDVLRDTGRVGLVDYEGVLFGIVHPNLSHNETQFLCEKMQFTTFMTYDAGGSTFLKLLGNIWYDTYRVLYQLLKF